MIAPMIDDGTCAYYWVKVLLDRLLVTPFEHFYCKKYYHCGDCDDCVYLARNHGEWPMASERWVDDGYIHAR